MSDTGIVVARYRRHCLVETANSARVSCQLRRRSLNPVVGDRVSFDPQPDGTGTLSTVDARDSTLMRIDSRGRPELIAANLSQIVIVLAPDPTPDWFLVDRYLTAAELEHLDAVIAFNKIDLTESAPEQLGEYSTLGYAHCRVSAKLQDGLAELKSALHGKRNVLIGQSGVGKSSLLNALVGESLQTVGTLSEKSRLGRHTTTTAVLHPLCGGGDIIDSPGARDFAPYIGDIREVARGFREFERPLELCRFQDCRHLAEPGCGVKTAVVNGAISTRRYASYRRLFELTESMQSARY
jgi:ribosome biogenesis GTPase